MVQFNELLLDLHLTFTRKKLKGTPSVAIICALDSYLSKAVF